MPNKCLQLTAVLPLILIYSAGFSFHFRSEMNVTVYDVDRMSTCCNELCQLSLVTQSLAGFGCHEELHPGIFYFSKKNPKGDLTCSEKAVRLPCYTHALFNIRRI